MFIRKHVAIVDERKNFFKPKSKPSTEEFTESRRETMFQMSKVKKRWKYISTMLIV